MTDGRPATPRLVLTDLGLRRGGHQLFRGLELAVGRGQTALIEGGNGSGKSSLLRALARDSTDKLELTGSVLFNGMEVLSLGEQAYRTEVQPRWSLLGDDAAATLLPTERLQRQFRGAKTSRDELMDLLLSLGFADPELILEQQPGQLSWGSRFGIAASMALSRRPDLLVLDDIRYARDAPSTDQWIFHLRRLQVTTGLSIIVLCRSANSYAALKPEQIVHLPGRRSLREPSAKALRQLAAAGAGRRTGKPGRRALKVEHLSVLLSRASKWPRKPRSVFALQSASFDLCRGELLALVGASPSGKTVLALTLARLLEPTLGRVSLRSHATDTEGRSGLLLCFEDAAGSLDQRFTAGEVLDEAAGLSHIDWATTAEPRQLALAAVGLDSSVLDRRCRELSLSEAQLLSLARHLLLSPAVLVIDNALSALDDKQQAQLLTLLQEIRQKHDLATLWFTHDLRGVPEKTDRTGVMYAGRLVELGTSPEVFANRHHPYTRVLLGADETQHRTLQLVAEGGTPDASRVPKGCAYHPRCPRSERGRCDTEEPELVPIATEGQHMVACWHPHV